MPSRELLSRPSRLYALVAALYVLAFPYHPGLRSPNELCRLWQTRAIVEHGTLSLNQTLRDHGWVGDLSVMNGRLYPSKAPLLSFLAVPLYKALSLLGGGHKEAVPELPLVYFSRLFLTVLPTLGMLGLMRRFLLTYVSAAVADGVTCVYALGSLAFSYSLLFMSHQTAAVLLFCSFYSMWQPVEGEWKVRWYLLAGGAAGAAVMAEYTAALGVIALALYGGLSLGWQPLSLGQRRERLVRAATCFVLGALPFIASLMAYHTVCFGSPFETGYKHLFDAAYQPWHLGGFLGIRYPDPSAFALSFFSPLRGLFTHSPFLLLAFPGLWVLHKSTQDLPVDRALLWMTLTLFLCYTYFTSSFAYASWGWTTGPRHLTGLVPFLALPVARLIEKLRAIDRFRGSLMLGMACALCGGSVLATGALTFVNYIPDTVSNPLFGLVLPLFVARRLPPSLLSLWLPTPVPGGPLDTVRLLFSPGALLLWGLGVAAVWSFLLLRGPLQVLLGPPLMRWAATFVGLLTCAAYLGLLAGATRHDAADTSAIHQLEAVWSTSPGDTLTFWPDTRD